MFVLYFLNKVDFTDNVNNDDLENLRCVKRILVREFEDYGLNKLTQVLNLVDHLFVLITFENLDDILDGNQKLKEKNFYLISFKPFVNKNEE